MTTLADCKVMFLESDSMRKRKEKTKYMPMMIIELGREKKKKTRSPLLIDIMCAKRKIHAMKKNRKSKKLRDMVFFMRHVMNFVIDLYEKKREKLT